MKNKFNLLSALVLSVLTCASAYAFPIAAPGTEGQQVFADSNTPVVATYQGNSASFSNDLYLALDSQGRPGNDGNLANDLFIFNNHASAVGSTANLGSFTAGTELLFRLHVNNTGFDYFTGPASRNPDDHFHARVQQNWQPNTSLVSFEDLFNTPEGANGFNDLSYSFTNTSTTPVTSTPPIPEPEAYLLMGMGVVTLVARGRRRA